MEINLHCVGGYDGVGKNMTVIEFEDDAIVLDIGLNLENFIVHKKDERGHVLDVNELVKIGAIPNDSMLKGIKDKIRGIIPSHVHLDHIGAIPYLAHKYDCPVYATKFCLGILEQIYDDENIKKSNELKSLDLNKEYHLSKNLKVELIDVSHSTMHSAMILIEYKGKKILYANDYKIEDKDYNTLEKLGLREIDLMISNSLYAHSEDNVGSENDAHGMLIDTFINLDVNNRAIFVTTFASHIKRIQSICDVAKRLKRKVVFFGSSMKKYSKASKYADIFDFEKHGELLIKKGEIKTRLKEISKNKKNYMIVCTGHQGEPNSFMYKLANQDIKFNFQKGDIIVFSSKTIPTKLNKMQKGEMLKKLNDMGANIIEDVHVSGHLSAPDHRIVQEKIKPKFLIPTHADLERKQMLLDIAKEFDVDGTICNDQHVYTLDI